MATYGDARAELEHIRSLRNNVFNDSRRLIGELSAPNPYHHLPFTAAAAAAATASSSFRMSPVRGSVSTFHPDRQQEFPPAFASPLPRSTTAGAASASFGATASSAFSNNGHVHGGFGLSGADLHSSFGHGAAASVITAFRQLQARSRYAEQEHAEAARQRDALRRQIEASQRTQSFLKSQTELEANENFQNMRATTDDMVAAKRDLELHLMTLQDASISTQRSNAHERALVVALEGEVSEVQAKVHALRATNRALENELKLTEGRCERVAHSVESSPPARQKHRHRAEEAICACEENIENAERATAMTRQRCDALQRYSEMILGINGDLCRRIMETASTREHIRDLATKLTPPRYQWPKELPYDSILNAIGDAAAEKAVHDNHASVAAAADAAIRSSPPAVAATRMMGTADFSRLGGSSATVAALASRQGRAGGDAGHDGGGNGNGAEERAGDAGPSGYSGMEGGVWFGKDIGRDRDAPVMSAGAAILSEGGHHGSDGERNLVEPMWDPVLAAVQASAASALQTSAAAIQVRSKKQDDGVQTKNLCVVSGSLMRVNDQVSTRKDKFDLDTAYRHLAMDAIGGRSVNQHRINNNNTNISSSRGRRPHSAPLRASRHVPLRPGPQKQPPPSSSPSAVYGAAINAAVSRSRDAYVRALDKLANTTATQALSPSHYNGTNLQAARAAPPRHATPREHAISRAAARSMSARMPAATGRGGFVPAGNAKSSFNVAAKGSKVARATTHFAAAVAARLKAQRRETVDERLLEPLVDPYRY